ncbi:MAG: efflux RND transporter periplasmic adaptor subunit [Rivularia sp. (in: cyanobacteria)]
MDDKLNENLTPPSSDNNIFDKNHLSQKKILEISQNKEFIQNKNKNKNIFQKPLFLLLPIGILIFIFTPPGRSLLNQITSTQTKSEQKSNSITTTSENILTVQTKQIQSVDSYLVKRSYNGTVVPRRTSSFGFERSGKLTSIVVDKGTRVKAGQTLAFLDTKTLRATQRELLAQRAQLVAKLKELQAGVRSQTIAAARANVNQLKSQLQLARSKNQRRQRLYTQGAISKEQSDEATSDLNSKQANLESAQSKLNELLAGTRPEQIEAQEASIEQLDAKIASVEVELEKSILKAPFSGTISARLVDEGTVVAMGNPVFRLVEDGNLEAHVGVPVNAANKIKLGATLPVKIGEQNYSARVLSKLPELEQSTRTTTVILKLNPEAVGKVTSGQVVRLQLDEKISETGYWLPTTALVKGVRGLWSCYVLGEAEQSNQLNYFSVKRKDVEILHNIGDRVLVQGTLQNGDMVITNGNHRLVTGMKVQPSSQTVKWGEK